MSKKFAVFDIDGTLIRWQLYHGLVNTLAKDGHLGAEAYEQLREVRKTWKHRQHPEAFKDYERYLVKMYLAAITDLPVKEFEKAAAATVDEYKQQAYVYTRDLIGKLKEEGYFLLAISGSHHEMIEEIAKHYGFDDFVGSTYEVADGKYTGKESVPSKDKASYLRKFVEKHDLDMSDSVGVGDTISDKAFLELVSQPIAFNPERKLFDEARTQGWKIVVERKNVVYELESSDDDYKLI